jgi:membrane protein required for beta-lactamase induction
MMAVVLWWGYDSSLALESWQLFCGGDTTVVCYRIMAVVLW